jgi:sterol desaturase/sphingolipid hydroxylase (fatty acid hydroxylase superfamily)
MSPAIHQFVRDLAPFLTSLWSFESLYQLGVCALVFIPLALLTPGKREQPSLHSGMVPDALYWLFAPQLVYTHVQALLWQSVFPVLLVSGIASAGGLGNLHDGLPSVLSLPVPVQALLIVAFMDVFQYWTHRLFHTATMWRFHAVHHSAVTVDWLTSARFHPVDTIIHSTCVYIIVYIVGFSPQAWLLVGWFNTAYSPLVHANLNWTFGPCRYLLASPVFHRWHHTYAEEGGNKNFAATFPCLDLLFGTYFEPTGLQPRVFGAPDDAVPERNILGQVVYPFLGHAGGRLESEAAQAR